MSTLLVGYTEADWLATPAAVRSFILAQQQEIKLMRDQFTTLATTLATELASLRERIGRSSRNSSKAPTSNGHGFT